MRPLRKIFARPAKSGNSLAAMPKRMARRPMMLDTMAKASDGGAHAGRDPKPLLHDLCRKPHDRFPLPLMDEFALAVMEVGRKSRRRVERKAHVVKEVNNTISALNSMYEAPGETNRFHAQGEDFVGISEAQQEVQRSVLSSVLEMGHPTGPSGTGALRQLRAVDGYAEDQTVGAVTSYDPDLVSLPGAGWKPIPLSELWGPGGRERVDDFVRTQLLLPDVAQQHVAACGVKRLYFDPRPRTWLTSLFRSPGSRSPFSL